MILLPFILLLAVSGVVTNYTIDVPRGDWSYVDVVSPETNAVINCEFEVWTENAEVRVVWIARKDLDLLRLGKRGPVIAATDFTANGGLRQLVPSAGDYALVVENSPAVRSTAKVHMKVWVKPAARPAYASTQRRLSVIVVSCLVFLGMVSFSVYRLRR